MVLKRTIADPDEVYFYMLGSRFYKVSDNDNYVTEVYYMAAFYFDNLGTSELEKKYTLEAKPTLAGQHEYIDMGFLTVGEGYKYALLGGTTSASWASNLAPAYSKMYIDVVVVDPAATVTG